MPAGEAGDAVVAALAAGGVDCLFFTSGSEIAFFQESIAKAGATGKPAPRMIVVTHEHASLNAALGYSAVTGKVSATAVHVDAGTLHHGAAIHTAMRANLPIVMTAGFPPTSATGTSIAARNQGGHLWLQQTYDQHSVVRQYVKWDHRLTAHDSPGLLTSRALQMATAEPAGPVYLAMAPEVSMAAMPAHSFPTVHGLGRVVAAAPDPDGIREVAERLLSARAPRLVVSGSGRDPRTVPELVALCELLGLPVAHASTRNYMSFPMAHPLLQLDADLSDADVVVVLEAEVPWLPGPRAPKRDSWVAVLGHDPVKSKIPTYEFTANLRLAGDPLQAIRALRREARDLMTPDHADRAHARAKEAARASGAYRAGLAAEVARLEGSPIIQPLQVTQALADIVDDDAVVFDDTLPHNRVFEFLRCSRPGSYFFTPGTSGGWAPGAAFGAKLALPGRDVIAVTGDGFYMFATPAAALWSAVHYGAPYLTVVYQNRSWATGTLRTAKTYPDGFAQRSGLEGGYFDPPMDFALEAQACGAYGENVKDPAQLRPALLRGLEQVRAGKPAVISVWLPRHLQAD
jgi:acetolactate synthase-1/2/3 large subunit